jgi:LysM repeat protein
MNTEAEANTTPIKNSGAVYHYIVSGDTLYNISRRY